MHATWLGTACLCLVEGLDMSWPRVFQAAAKQCYGLANLGIKTQSAGPWTDQPRKYSANFPPLNPHSAALSLCGECQED